MLDAGGRNVLGEPDRPSLPPKKYGSDPRDVASTKSTRSPRAESHSYQILSRVLQSPLPHAVRPDPAYRNADLRKELKIDEPRFYPRTEGHTPIASLFAINLEFQFLRFAAVFTSCGADYCRFLSVTPIHAVHEKLFGY